MSGTRRAGVGHATAGERRQLEKRVEKEELEAAADHPSAIGNNKASIAAAIAQYEAGNREGAKRTTLQAENLKGMIAELKTHANDIGIDPKIRRISRCLWMHAQQTLDLRKKIHRTPVPSPSFEVVPPKEGVEDFDGPKASFAVPKKERW